MICQRMPFSAKKEPGCLANEQDRKYKFMRRMKVYSRIVWNGSRKSINGKRWNENFYTAKRAAGKMESVHNYRREILLNPEDDVCGGPFPGSSFFE